MPNKSLQRRVLHAAGEFHYYVMTKYQGQKRQIVFVCIEDRSLLAVENLVLHLHIALRPALSTPPVKVLQIPKSVITLKKPTNVVK